MNFCRSRRIKIIIFSSSFALIVYLLRRYRRYVLLKKSYKIIQSKQTSSSSIALNKQFYNQLIVIIRILIPRLNSDTFLLLVTHLTSLISRTFLSVYIAKIDGAIVKSLVQRNPRDFIRTICIFLMVSIPASFINSFIKFAESKLALAFRSKLTRYAYGSYFRVRNIYLIVSFSLFKYFLFRIKHIIVYQI